MNNNTADILATRPNLTFVLMRTESTVRGLEWYAAFRDEDATELTPEAGFGYGSTADEAELEAITDFNENH